MVQSVVKRFWEFVLAYQCKEKHQADWTSQQHNEGNYKIRPNAEVTVDGEVENQQHDECDAFVHFEKHGKHIDAS